MKNLRNDFDEKEAAEVLNFGRGVRGCLGRLYAKQFIKNYFEDMVKVDFFNPEKGHL